MRHDDDPPPIHPPPPKPGDGSSIDMTNLKDQAMVRQMASRRPRRFRLMDEGRRDRMVEDLEWAIKQGKEYVPVGENDNPLEGAKLVVSSVKTLLEIEKANQADDHHADSLDAAQKRPEQAQQSVIVIVGPNPQIHETGRRAGVNVVRAISGQPPSTGG